MTVKIASPEIEVFAELVFKHYIPTKCARARFRVVWSPRCTWRRARKKIGIYQNYGLAHQRTCRIEKAEHALLIAGEIPGQQRNVAVDLGSARTNHCVSAIQRIGRADARGERCPAADRLRSQTRSIVECQATIQRPSILDKFS